MFSQRLLDTSTHGLDFDHSDLDDALALNQNPVKVDLALADRLLLAGKTVPFELYKDLHLLRRRDPGVLAENFRKNMKVALSQGTWGKRGAGLMILDPSVEELFLLDRSRVSDGRKASNGGARDVVDGVYEHPLVTAISEAHEENGGEIPPGEIVGCCYYERPEPHIDFTYHTYLLVIDPAAKSDFNRNIRLNDEHTGCGWYDISKVHELGNVHDGVLATLRQNKLI